jgi:peptidoglycan/LPS O-acetylase OafA/YrhL
MLISVQALRAIAAWAVVCHLSAGGFVAQRYGVNPYVMFAVCAATIGLASWASYEFVEKRSYQWLKARIDGETAAQLATALSRQKY